MMTLFEDTKVSTSVFPQAASAGAINGVAVDTEGYDDAMISVVVGAVTGSPSAFTVAAKVQESADGSTSWTDISDAALAASVTAINKTGEIRVDLRGVSRKRYVRAVVTPGFTGGTSPTALIGATVLLGQPDRSPSGNSTTAD